MAQPQRVDAESVRVTSGNAPIAARGSANDNNSPRAKNGVTSSNASHSNIRYNREMQQMTKNEAVETAQAQQQIIANTSQQAANATQKPTAADRAHEVAAKVEAGTIGIALVWQLAWFYPIQLLFAILFLVFTNLGQSHSLYSWFINFWVNTNTMMVLAWMGNIALGTGFMIYAATSFAIGLVSLTKGKYIFPMFAFCLGAYWAPYLFFVPWVFLWIGVVVWSQK